MNINTPCLVLNASFEPISIATAKRALKMWAKGIARIEEVYPRPFYRDMFLPSVIRLNNYRRVPIKKHTVSRRNLLIRDRYTCQYCSAKLAPAKLTLDHVMPRSRGGQATWSNLVTACRPCNNVKADKTPEEAGMKLLIQPREMSLHSHRSLMRQLGEDVQSWKKYLYY